MPPTLPPPLVVKCDSLPDQWLCGNCGSRKCNKCKRDITLKEEREKKKNIEEGNKSPRLDEIKNEIASFNEMISDIAISTLMKGESVYLKDEYDNEYEPAYKVTFKKIK